MLILTACKIRVSNPASAWKKLKPLHCSWSAEMSSGIPTKHVLSEGEVPAVCGQKDALPHPPLDRNRSSGQGWPQRWVLPISAFLTSMMRFWPGSSQAAFKLPGLRSTIVWGLRLHRILLSIVAGMGLAIAGAVMQGILKNPLASPFTLGISSAASFGAALAIVLGAGFVGGEWLIIGNAFVFTLLASMTVYGLAKYKGITPETMILAGIAIMYLFQAMTSFLQVCGTCRAGARGGLLDDGFHGQVVLG